MVEFPMVAKHIKYKLAELKTDRFVDKSTRGLTFIITLLNANLELFAVVQFNIFLNAAGHVSTRILFC